MSVSLDDALSEGFDQLITRSGAVLVAVVYVIGLATTLFVQSAQAIAFEYIAGELRKSSEEPVPPSISEPNLPLAFDIPIVVIVLSIVALAIVNLMITLVALRVFADDETDEILPRHYSGLAWPTLNAIAGGIVFAIIVGLGFTLGLILLALPGFFLLVSLYFYTPAIAIDDENFIEALGTSWELTSGHRLILFILGVVVVAISFGISFVIGLVTFPIPRAVAPVVTQLGSAVSNMFTLAVTARTYLMLRDGDRHREVIEEEEEWQTQDDSWGTDDEWS